MREAPRGVAIAPRAWLALAGLALGLAACGGVPEQDALEGQWLVDFGTSKGVLAMKRGHVHAACYPGSPAIGTYSLIGDELTLLLDFTSSGRPQDFSGRIVPETDQPTGPFHLKLTADFEGESLPFAPYTGDCSEFAAAK